MKVLVFKALMEGVHDEICACENKSILNKDLM